MAWLQKIIELKGRPRGFHLITQDILSQLPELSQIKTGIFHLFIQHSLASLSINENYDPDVRADFESHFNQLVPENSPHFRHTLEGSDDMPAHLKASLLGSHVSIPVSKGKLLLGSWQGIYLGEHRNHGGPRTLVATLEGDSKK